MNVKIVQRQHPLILEIKIEPDTMLNNLRAVSIQSLSLLRSLIDSTLLVRHYKKLILDLDQIEMGASALLSKMLMCYEKAASVKCDVYTFNATSRIYTQYVMLRMNDIIPIFRKDQTPKPEDYNQFFHFQHRSVSDQISKLPMIQMGDDESHMISPIESLS